jgi:hypothetical protein
MHNGYDDLHKRANVLQVVQILVQVGNVVGDVLDARVELLQLVLVHLNQRIHGSIHALEIHVRPRLLTEKRVLAKLEVRQIFAFTGQA